MARPFAGLISALALVGASAVGLTARAADPAPLPDRYGPAPVAGLPAAGLQAPSYVGPGRETARAAPLRILSWPGKSGPASPQTAPAASAAQPYAPPAYTPPVYAAPTPAAAPVVSPSFAPAPTAPTRAAPPVLYFGAPTPGTPPPAATSLAGPLASAAPAAGGQHARLYSVHRAYGLQPDPAPIPPQFFAQTADLSTPATPDPIPNRAANAATRNAVNAARLASAEAN